MRQRQPEHNHVGPRCPACDAEVAVMDQKALSIPTVTDEDRWTGRWAVYLVIGLGLVFLLNGLPGILRAIARHNAVHDLCMERQPESDTLVEYLRHWTRCQEVANDVAPIVPKKETTR